MVSINHLLALPIRLSRWRFGGSGGLGGNTSRTSAPHRTNLTEFPTIRLSTTITQYHYA